MFFITPRKRAHGEVSCQVYSINFKFIDEKIVIQLIKIPQIELYGP
jgi:hypothetical protein